MCSPRQPAPRGEGIEGDRQWALVENYTTVLPATVQGIRFHAAVSLVDVITDDPGSWEPALEVEGVPTPLRLSSRLDDVDGKRRRVHYPAARVDGVPVRPSYTADDELRIEVGG